MTQDGDSEAKKEEKSLPEVEAELVRETPPSEDAFDDDAAASTSSADADESDAEADDPEAGEIGAGVAESRKSTLTPGVMLFLAFVVVALIAFGVWRFQMRSGVDVQEGAAAPSEETVQESAPEVAVPPVEASDEIIVLEPAGDEEAAFPPESESVTESLPEPEAKIENLPDDELTAPETLEESNGFLPPVSDAGAAKLSNTVEDGAKEAMRRFQEAENAAGDAGAEEVMAPEVVEGNQPTDEMIEPGQTPADGGVEDAPEDAAIIEETPLPTDEETAVESAALIPENEAPQAVSLPDENGQVDALQVEIEALKASFDEERTEFLASLQAAEARNVAQTEEIARLQTELQNLNAAASEEVARLQTELLSARNNGVQQSARQIKASFALAALSRAVDQGAPFAQELNAVAEFAPEARAVLGGHAQTGVKSDVTLRESFGGAAREALAAAGQAKAGNGFSGLVARMKSLVSVRPAQPMSGDSPGAVLSRAENALEQGEVSIALLQLESLQPAGQEAMADWITDARARVEVEAAISELAATLSGEVE